MKLQGQVRIQGQNLAFRPLKPGVRRWENRDGFNLLSRKTAIDFGKGVWMGTDTKKQYNKVHDRTSLPGKGNKAADMAYTA